MSAEIQGSVVFANCVVKKVTITITFCCDNLLRSKFMPLEKPGNLCEFFSYFVATVYTYISGYGFDCRPKGH